MKLLLRGVHLSLRPRHKAYVQAHLFEPVQRIYRDEAAEMDVHLADTNGPKGGEDKECRVTLRIPNIPSIHITERGENIFACIDVTRDRLERILKRDIAKMRQGGGTVDDRQVVTLTHADEELEEAADFMEAEADAGEPQTRTRPEDLTVPPLSYYDR